MAMDELRDLTPDELAAFFPPKAPKPEPGVFELGLVLGGTVSAGAYTAGVLDFLIEALDAWQRAKDEDHPDAPRHRVVITTLGGASGGAINGAILLRAAGREFPHGAVADNPFFSSWTQGVDLMRLLSLDGDSQDFASLFNCTAIEAQAQASITWDKGCPLGSETSPGRRAYLADPLRLFMMVANLTGIPYRISLRGESKLDHGMVCHADYLRFALNVEGGQPQKPAARPDEIALRSDAPEGWDAVREAALATCAFPLAFRGRELKRQLALCGYRAVAVPGDDGSVTVHQLRPKWAALPTRDGSPGMTPFANVDGGTLNNEPLDVVRMALAGVAGHNPRDPRKASRAVVLIDPFTDAEALKVPDTGRVTAMVGPLVSSLMRQVRFKPADLALAGDEETYSRFLVAPVRKGRAGERLIGSKAIAAGGLGGFLGFLSATLLRHDYLLGRANAHSFLTKHMVFPEHDDENEVNPVFDGARWTATQKDLYRHTEGDKSYLPLIPVMKWIPVPEPPDWPKDVALPGEFEAAVNARLNSIYDRLKAELVPRGGLKTLVVRTYLAAGWPSARRALRRKVVTLFEDALKDQGLAG
jgi:hypothetical protein